MNMSLSLGEVTQSLCLLACLLNLAKHFNNRDINNTERR
jgi:hypothetical protein